MVPPHKKKNEFTNAAPSTMKATKCDTEKAPMVPPHKKTGATNAAPSACHAQQTLMLPPKVKNYTVTNE